MDSEEIERIKFNEWNALIKKISKDCKTCDGLSYIPITNERRAVPCTECIPKAKTITYLKESGMNIEDIKSANLNDYSLLTEKCIFINGEQKERKELAFGILKEEAKKQRKVYYVEMSVLVPQLKSNNRDFLQYDTLFINSIDIYKTIDQFVLPWFDGILFTYKNNTKKKIIVAGLSELDGYASRFLETYGNYIKSVFI